MRLLGGLLTIVAVLALGAASASAAQRYASPTGAGTACGSTTPCSLKEAVENAKDGDEVVVGTGTYATTGTFVSSVNNLYVHGDFEAPMPRLAADNEYVLVVSGARARIAYLSLSGTGSGAVGAYCNAEGTLERVEAIASGDGATGVSLGSDCTIRDSLVRASGIFATGIKTEGVFTESNAASINTTVVATGNESKGAYAACIFCFVGSAKLTLANTIASGEKFDLEAGGMAQITAINSNFAKTQPGSPGIVDGGGNQSVLPVFVDAAGGNFAEAASSPTIDAGTLGATIGQLDLAGNPRVIDGAVDIGAYEFVPPPGEIGALALTPKKFRAAKTGEAIASAKKKPKKRAPIGTTVTYSLSRAAQVEFFVERKQVGRKVKGKCSKPSKANRKRKKCVTWVLNKAGFAVPGVAGSNTFKFSGRIGGKTLKPGAYKLKGATRSASFLTAFTIVK